MKFFIMMTVLMSALSASASDKMVSDVLDNQTCRLEFKEDVIVKYGQETTAAGHVLLVAKNVDEANNRRLKAGRILKIEGRNENYVKFKDAHIDSMCFYYGNMCHELNRVKVDDFDKFGLGKVKLVCNQRPTIDI